MRAKTVNSVNIFIAQDIIIHTQINCPNVLQYFYFRGCPFPHPWPTFSFHQFLVPREFSKVTQIMLLARKLKPFYLCFGHHLDVYGTDILESLFNLMRGNTFLKIFFCFTTATRLGSCHCWLSTLWFHDNTACMFIFSFILCKPSTTKES